MPRKRKRARRRKVGATPKKTRVFGGKRYTLKSCYRTKTAAKKSAAAHRKKGKRAAARVVKSGNKYCKYTRG